MAGKAKRAGDAKGAVILCPGPSLAQLKLPDTDAIVIGVNRAVTAFKCAWWCALDSKVVLENTPVGTPKLLTTVHSKSELGDYRDAMTNDDMRREFPECGWTIYSATCALALAAHLGATSIDVYGADWEPDAPDFDGVQSSRNRGEIRWDSERQIWESMVDHLRERGVTVNRVIPQAVQ